VFNVSNVEQPDLSSSVERTLTKVKNYTHENAQQVEGSASSLPPSG
jgi:hypothetical protein